MRGKLPSLVLSTALGCSVTAPPRPSTAPANPRGSATSPLNAHPTRASGALQQVFTGQARPSLRVKNGFPIAQHVFIDWQPYGVLAPSASKTFELSVGTHTVTCADSLDPDDHAAAVTEPFASGYAYSYEIHP